MKWFMNLKIGTKLITGFVIVAIIAGIVGAVGIVNIKHLDDSNTIMYERNTVPLGEAEDISTAFQDIRVKFRSAMLLDTLVDKKAELDKIAEDQKIIEESIIIIYEAIKENPELKELHKKFQDSKIRYYPALEQGMNLVLANKNKEAMEILSSTGILGILSKEVQGDIDAMTDEIVAAASNRSDANSKQADISTNTMLMVLAIGIIVSLVLGITLSRAISKPVRKMSDVAKRLATGDLDVEIYSESKDEIGVLTRSFTSVIENIKEQAMNAQSIARGELSLEITPKSDKDILAKSMKQVVDTLGNLVVETGTLTKAAIEGRLSVRGNEAAFQGGYRDILLGVNKTLDTLVGHLDEIPAPLLIMDKEFNIRYMNKLAAEIAGSTQQQIIGKKCYQTFKTGDCNTANCACQRAMQTGTKSISETDAHPMGMNLDITYTGIPIKDEKGNIIGALELIIDQTDVKNAARIAAKQAKFQEVEVEKLLNNLAKLSQGNLQLYFEDIKSDEDTKVIGENFESLNKNLSISAEAIKNYINEISDVLTQMSNSNMDVSVTRDYLGDFGPIKESLNMIIMTFNRVLGEMSNSADQVSSGSNQVSEGSQMLSQGTTEQASAIEELTSSITQIAAQTKQNADNANKANELANKASVNAMSGNKQMKEMLSSMSEISESSSNISKIIKVIDEIAFQTNILALNAAVEAARAGQHGKGFAVVAEEVRNLAARSANAAKETTALIEGSIKKVEMGTKIANETAIALDEIVSGVEKAANLVGNIATASNQQATGIAQINKGIEQVSQVVQTNSATAQESASASEELSSQAEMLKDLVSNFTLKKNPMYYKESDFAETNTNTNIAKSAVKKSTKIKKKIELDDSNFGKY